MHIDTNDPAAAGEILRRHDKGEPEANITSAVRNFLTVTGLVKAEQIFEENPLHVEVSEAGETAAAGAAKQLEQLRQERDRVTVTIARRELRKWLRESSDEGQAVEDVVRLLGVGKLKYQRDSVRDTPWSERIAFGQCLHPDEFARKIFSRMTGSRLPEPRSRAVLMPWARSPQAIRN